MKSSFGKMPTLKSITPTSMQSLSPSSEFLFGSSSEGNNDANSNKKSFASKFENMGSNLKKTITGSSVSQSEDITEENEASFSKSMNPMALMGMTTGKKQKPSTDQDKASRISKVITLIEDIRYHSPYVLFEIVCQFFVLADFNVPKRMLDWLLLSLPRLCPQYTLLI